MGGFGAGWVLIFGGGRWVCVCFGLMTVFKSKSLLNRAFLRTTSIPNQVCKI